MNIAEATIDHEVRSFLMKGRHPAIQLTLYLDGDEIFEAGLIWSMVHKYAPIGADGVFLPAPALRRLSSLWVPPPWYWVPQWHHWLTSFATKWWNLPEKESDGWRLRFDHVRALVVFILGSAWMHEVITKPVWWHLAPQDRECFVLAILRGLIKHYLPDSCSSELEKEAASAANFIFSELDDIIIARLVEGAGGKTAILRINSSDVDVIAAIRRNIKRSDILAPYRGGGNIAILPIKSSGEGGIILRRLKSIFPNVTLVVDEII